MNVVDSSAWLEYFADGSNAEFFAEPIQNTARLLVPTLCIYEVFKRVLQQRDELAALEAAGIMQSGSLVQLDLSIALSAAKLSLVEKLSTPDSIVLATARAFDALLWTQDSDFEGLAGVRYRKRKD